MKKMILWGLFITLAIPMLWSCEKENSEALLDIIVTVKKEKFNTSLENELKSLVKAVSKEKIKNFETVELVKATDSEGEFYAVVAKVINEKDQIISLTMPLNKSEQKQNHVGYSLGCTMKCTPGTACDRCDQSIIERCKRQTCTCTRGHIASGCSASMTFGD